MRPLPTPLKTSSLWRQYLEAPQLPWLRQIWPFQLGVESQQQRRRAGTQQSFIQALPSLRLYLSQVPDQLRPQWLVRVIRTSNAHKTHMSVDCGSQCRRLWSLGHMRLVIPHQWPNTGNWKL